MSLILAKFKKNRKTELNKQQPFIYQKNVKLPIIGSTKLAKQLNKYFDIEIVPINTSSLTTSSSSPCKSQLSSSSSLSSLSNSLASVSSTSTSDDNSITNSHDGNSSLFTSIVSFLSTASITSASSLSPINQQDNLELPNYLWRKILNYLVYNYLPARLDMDSEKSMNFHTILKYSLVCKNWADKVIPFLHFGTLQLASERSYFLLNKLVYGDGVNGVPLRIHSIEFGMAAWNISKQFTTTTLPKLQFNFRKLHKELKELGDDNSNNENINNNNNSHHYRYYKIAPTLKTMKITFNSENMKIISQFRKMVESSSITHLDLNGMNTTGNLTALILTNVIPVVPRTLVTLDLGNNRLGSTILIPWNMDHLIGENGTLVELNLENNRLQAEGAAIISNYLRVNRSLRSLNLSFNLIMDNGATSIVEALWSGGEYIFEHEKPHVNSNNSSNNNMLTSSNKQYNQTLTHLSLNENGIGEVGGKAIAKMIANNTSLRSLILDTNRFGDAAMDNIIESLSINKNLKRVSLAMVGGTLNGRAVGNYISGAPQLEVLNIMVNDLGDNGHYIFDAMSSQILQQHKIEQPIGYVNDAGDVNNLINIKTLNLSYTKIRSLESKIALQSLILVNDKIQTLNLSYAFADSEVYAIIRALLFNRTLTELDLSLNSLESSHGHTLGAMLLTNRSLTTINLGGNILGQTGVTPILNALLVNDTLKSLNIRKNQIRQLDPNLMFDVLCVNKTLTHLDIYQNALSTSIGHEIACGLMVNTTLRSIDISFNDFGVECGNSFEQALTASNSLKHINLSGNCFGYDQTYRLHGLFHKKFDSFVIEDGNRSKPKPPLTIPAPTPNNNININNNLNNANNNSFKSRILKFFRRQ